MLNQLVNQTRDIIVQLYLGCERDFYTGIKLLRVIIEEKMQETMEAALANLKAETVKQVKVLSQKNKENETTKRQNEVKAIQDAVNLNKNDINVASDEREDDLKKLTDELTNKKKDLDTAKQKSDDFKKELELINAKIKQYTDEEKLVPAPGDANLAALIKGLDAKKAGIEADKKAVDDDIKTLTSEYETIKTRYDR
jgi:chromosome segregation ATPase